MSVERLKRDFLSAAQEYKRKYKLEGENPEDLDKFKRLMDIYFHLDDIGGVTSIIAGSGISVSPSSGVGDVTVSLSSDAFSYGSFYSTIDQPLLVVGTPQVVQINSTYEADGISISDNKIYFSKAGTYQFSYIAQVFNLSNSQQDCEFFIKYNGTTYDNSGSTVTLQPRKSSGEASEQQMSLILTGTAQNDNDYIELYWSGSSVEMILKYIPSSGALPATPSVIANVIPITAGGSSVSSIDQLSDVSISSLEDGQFLIYNSTTGKWENASADVTEATGELDIDGGTFLAPGGGFSFDAGTFI